jgi:drug/metabolite transporter (DMT)-like permease
MLVLVGAFFWAAQVLLIGKLSPKLDSLKLAFTEFMVCAGLSILVAFAIETITWSAIEAAAIPLLYGGLASVGIAYTIQVFVQKRTHPSHAAIIMGMEAVFAVIGGFLFLGEVLPFRGLVGCSLMLTGMIVSQLWGTVRRKSSLMRAT